ncbi:hypothetical protein KI387_014087, partial [Taxus chinensis]
LRNVQEHLRDMEIAQRRGIDTGDVSDIEDERPGEGPEQEEREDIIEERTIKAVMGVSSKPKLDVPVYGAILNVDELVDWI